MYQYTEPEDDGDTTYRQTAVPPIASLAAAGCLWSKRIADGAPGTPPLVFLNPGSKLEARKSGDDPRIEMAGFPCDAAVNVLEPGHEQWVSAFNLLGWSELEFGASAVSFRIRIVSGHRSSCARSLFLTLPASLTTSAGGGVRGCEQRGLDGD